MLFSTYIVAGITLILAIGVNSQIDGNKCPAKKHVVCYWASWATYRPSKGSHKINQIVPDSCTHIIYSFAGLSITGDLESLDVNVDLQKGGYLEVIGLKTRNPCLKVLLAVGGWNEGSEKYSLMAETDQSREKFASSVLQFLVFYGFDGIDIDWEYPAHRGGLRSDKDNFVKLLKALNSKLKPRNRMVTAAVSASLNVTHLAYDVRNMCAELDFVSIMGYDLHNPNVTSLHSPLLPENAFDKNATVDDVIGYYKRTGCPSNKIVLGIPAYGRTYTLSETKKTGIGSPISGPGKAGPYTREMGFLGYNEICDMLKSKGWNRVRLSRSACSYAWNNNLWVSYDDEEAVQWKARYALQEGLAGLMVWSIDTDDFLGTCTGKSYPLLRAINKALNNFVDWPKK